MSYRERIKKIKTDSIMDKLSDYEFPTLLRMLRRIHGTQKSVAEEMAISSYRLMYLEKGHFERMPEEDEILTLSEYFNLPASLFKKKARKFLETKHSA